jgi:hypothetical protein
MSAMPDCPQAQSLPKVSRHLLPGEIGQVFILTRPRRFGGDFLGLTGNDSSAVRDEGTSDTDDRGHAPPEHCSKIGQKRLRSRGGCGGAVLPTRSLATLKATVTGYNVRRLLGCFRPLLLVPARLVGILRSRPNSISYCELCSRKIPITVAPNRQTIATPPQAPSELAAKSAALEVRPEIQS